MNKWDRVSLAFVSQKQFEYDFIVTAVARLQLYAIAIVQYKLFILEKKVPFKAMSIIVHLISTVGWLLLKIDSI